MITSSLAEGGGVGKGVAAALKLPCPPNITVFWNGGRLLSAVVGLQILTGLMLRLRYNSSRELAFAVVLGISRERNNGWGLRYGHANGARLLFVLIFLHIGRGLYYGSYRYILV